ncbi:TetR/AcrR family transcriptional regulator [Maritimibacter dapengensis]|uniref:TetR/AcrR family transcriptional regulator n=1 Tax=Maritimibacter dapengensis TaxID=2836868 RepID=A0ABS6T030_9RHOB|nr:TetR/AcrR family transcriptional regulator [Maritimibacter dapengensis]
MDKVRRRKSAADRKAEIIDTVIDLAADMGPDRVTTQHLADRVGVTQPAIFRHFSTKSEIWEAVSEKLAQLVTHTAKSGPSDGSADTIPQHLGRYFELVTKLPALPAILHSRELHADNDRLRNRFQDLSHARRDWLTSLVLEGQESGTHRNDMNAPAVANMILSSVQGLTMHWTLDDRRLDLLEEGDHLVSTLMDALSR